MKNFKKYLALALAAVLLVAGTFAATVAWMTADADAKKNVFTVGDISIELDEETAVEGEGGTVNETQDGAEYVGVMPGDHLVKEVSLTNTGDVPVYAAVTVTVNNALEINKAIDQYYEAIYGENAPEIQEVYDDVFEGWGMNYTKTDAKGNALGMRLTITGDDMPEGAIQVDSVKTIDEYTNCGSRNWLETESDVIPFDGTISGGNEAMGIPAMNKYELRYVYYVHLDPNETFVPFTGLNVPTYFNNEQVKMFEGLTITVDASAIQADNFDGAPAAIAALYGVEVPKVYEAYVSDNDELAQAIADGKTSIFLNNGTYQMPAVAKGKTLNLTGDKNTVIEVVPGGQGEANGQLDYNLDGSKVTFNDLTIKTNSQLYAGYARLSATYNNCVIQNTYNCGVGTSVFNGCTFNITNEYLRVAGATSAEFNGCTFNTAGRAILVYQDGTNVAQTVTVKDCTFNATAAAHTWNGIHVAAVSIDGTNGTYTVNLEGNNTVGANFNGLWQIKAGEANVTVNE